MTICYTVKEKKQDDTLQMAALLLKEDGLTYECRDRPPFQKPE